MNVILTLLIVLLPIISWAGDDVATLEIQIEAIKSEKKGEVGVAIFNSSKGFPLGLDHSYEVVWLPVQEGQGLMSYISEALPPGEYAIALLHDENGNRKMDRTLLRFPSEGVGFSNDQRVVLSAPKFKKCQFPLAAGEVKKVVIKLDYRD